MQSARGMQGNLWEWVQSAREMLGDAGECRELTGVDAKRQGNAGKSRGMPLDLWEWMQSTREMLGNAGESQGNVSAYKVIAGFREVQGNARGM